MRCGAMGLIGDPAGNFVIRMVAVHYLGRGEVQALPHLLSLDTRLASPKQPRGRHKGVLPLWRTTASSVARTSLEWHLKMWLSWSGSWKI